DHAGSDRVREREVVDGLTNRARLDVDDATVAAALKLWETELGQANDREQQQLDRLLDVVVGKPDRRAPRRPAAVVDEDVDAAEGRNSSVDEPFQVGRVRDVATYRKCAEPLGLAVENVPPAREHG